MAKRVIIKPVITEKSEWLSEEKDQYTFVVDHKSTKPEIKQAVEERFDVNVKKVNTAIMPAKEKMRATRSGYVMGRKPAYKKAIVTLADGEVIDYYGEI
jgi:large subunit ribosomal protein L23